MSGFSYQDNDLNTIFQKISDMTSYVTNSSLSTTLSSYVTNSSLTTTLSSYLTSSSLNDYMKTSTKNVLFEIKYASQLNINLNTKPSNNTVGYSFIIINDTGSNITIADSGISLSSSTGFLAAGLTLNKYSACVAIYLGYSTGYNVGPNWLLIPFQGGNDGYNFLKYGQTT